MSGQCEQGNDEKGCEEHGLVVRKQGEQLRPDFSMEIGKIGTMQLCDNSIIVHEMLRMPSREAQE